MCVRKEHSNRWKSDAFWTVTSRMTDRLSVDHVMWKTMKGTIQSVEKSNPNNYFTLILPLEFMLFFCDCFCCCCYCCQLDGTNMEIELSLVLSTLKLLCSLCARMFTWMVNEHSKNTLICSQHSVAQKPSHGAALNAGAVAAKWITFRIKCFEI